MTIDLYYMPAGPTSRAIQMTAKAIGVELNLKLVNLQNGEHLQPEFIKMNPQHTIPTINDNGFCLWESRAISAYLVEKYAKNDSLYPKDPQKRAVVNQRLYFDMGTLQSRMGEYIYSKMKKQPDAEKFKKCEEALEHLNTMLEGKVYAAGDSLTIADITLVSTVSSLEAIGFDLSNYKNVSKWYAKCKETIPGYDINESGIVLLKKWLDSQ